MVAGIHTSEPCSATIQRHPRRILHRSEPRLLRRLIRPSPNKKPSHPSKTPLQRSHVSRHSLFVMFIRDTDGEEDDSWKECSLDLEEAYYKCCETRLLSSDGLEEPAKSIASEPQLGESNKKGKEKKVKKGKPASESLVDEVDNYQSEAHNVMTEGKSKDKKKKKEKLISAILDDNEQCGKDPKQEAIATMVNATNIPVEEKNVKSKRKKTKKDGLVSEGLPDKVVNEFDKGTSINNSESDVFHTTEDVATNIDNKISKKRKRLVSEEINSEPVEKVMTEECKRRKTDGIDESQESKLVTSLGSDGLAGKDSEEENGKVSANNSQEKSIEQLGTQSNGNLEKSGGKSGLQKSVKKQQNGSVEPKTVNAFQRVKVDKVVFTDERLHDNSYWAKDGAEIGYGAKAQEVLGQVKGRDFRHEKTKKKRGSYRGGLIDQQSHSVKFNYSDED